MQLVVVNKSIRLSTAKNWVEAPYGMSLTDQAAETTCPRYATKYDLAYHKFLRLIINSSLNASELYTRMYECVTANPDINSAEGLQIKCRKYSKIFFKVCAEHLYQEYIHCPINFILENSIYIK